MGKAGLLMGREGGGDFVRIRGPHSCPILHYLHIQKNKSTVDSKT